MRVSGNWPWIAGGLIAIMASLTFALIPSGEREPRLLFVPDSATVVAEGRSNYEAQCAACHGLALEGQPDWQTPLPTGRLPAPPHDASGHTWHHSEQMLFQITKHGVQRFAGPGYETDMPAYDGILSDSEILAVLSYIKSLWPAEIRERHDAMSLQASQN